MATSWDPAHWHVQMALSNDNLTITATTGYSVCGIAVDPITTKSIFGLRLDDTDGNGQVALGIANADVYTSSYLGGDVNGYGFWPGDEGLYFNGSKISTAPAARSNGMKAWVAVDPALRKFWLRANDDAWFGGTSPDPATGSGGFDIAFSGAIYPAVAVTRPGEVATGLFAAAALENVPAGFAEVNPSAVVIVPTITAFLIV
ncbi:hypothetical protein BA190_10225 [Labrys sp. WJW]|uniref:hypothetical protein n=1 Tax=Labrys sp. WJW TaxID=1737983 RepID=UPI00082FB416|nr:hypothetical protein [Labrys sp. WJW]OCC05270.1 hypothetical protein BA190_10225 [Labrys sp. WJW]